MSRQLNTEDDFLLYLETLQYVHKRLVKLMETTWYEGNLTYFFKGVLQIMDLREEKNIPLFTTK